MTKNEIKEFLSNFGPKDWYYYYDFNGFVVRPDMKHKPDSGLENWAKIYPIIANFVSNGKKVLDIGCNMGLYDFEMFKNKASVTAVDMDIKQALFFKKFIIENKNMSFDVNFVECNVMEKKLDIDSVDTVMFMCVLYHFEDKTNFVLDSLPEHKTLIVQCNLDRVNSNKRGHQPLADPNVVADLMKIRGYTDIQIHKIEKKYKKPIVVGQF